MKPPPLSAGPLRLTPEQEAAVLRWADDCLWTTPAQIEFNLRVFARVILAAARPGRPREKDACA
jgi:hypothetical protein